MSAISGKRKRDRLQIISEILESCLNPKSKTAIMFSVNLSYRMLVGYVTELQEAKLLEFFSETSKYVTTLEGEEYLRKFRELENIADFSSTNRSKNRS